jgi:hypothetical protein
MKRQRLVLFASILFFGLADSAYATNLGAVAQEVIRARQEGNRIINFWWLPLEYWIEAARELKKPTEEIDTVRRLFRSYLVIGVLDAEVHGDGTFDAATHALIGPAVEVRRNGTKVEILRDIDPKVARLTGELSYFLSTSLTFLSSGLRLFFLPNVDDKARPILQGLSSGELEITYARGSAPGNPLKFHWRTPLSSVAGHNTCPEGGEALEASWRYCPWHGIRVR